MEEKTYQLVSDGRRLDVQLSEEAGISRSRAAALMEEGYCLLEGKPCRKAGTKPPAGREVVLTVPAPKDAAPQAEDIPLEILYEDGDLAVVVKPRGMVVHPAAGHSEGTLVIDTCGTKRAVVESCMALAEQYGFTFVGGHPMAGTQYSGYKYSRANLFSGAAMVIVPPDFGDIALLSRVKELLAPAGFGSIHVTTAEEHDRAIAFTSQLTHLVSNAYVKSHTAGQLKGFTGGSYRDMTRVAWLNPEMWAELFLENADNLSAELSGLIAELEKYRAAIDSGDRETLTALLAEGRRIKEEAEGK